VALPQVPGGRAGLPRQVAGRLVPQRRHAGPRAGRRHGPPLLALRRARREARPGAVVSADHEVRRRAARLQRPGMARADQADADQLDRPVRGRRSRLQDGGGRGPGGRRRGPRLHDAARHALRRHVHGAVARARAGAQAHPPGSQGRSRGLRDCSRPCHGDRADVDRAREDRRVHRLVRAQSSQRRAHPDLDRRLRPGRLRHRRDHGRARPRRARLRVRPQVRAADPARHRRPGGFGGGGRGRAGSGLHRPRRGRPNGQLGPARRQAGEAGFRRHRRHAGSPGQGQGFGQLSAARLARQPAALLGHADPGRLLRRGWHRARPGRPASRPAAG